MLGLGFDEVFCLSGVGFEVVEFGEMAVGGTVAVRVADVFPFVRAKRADVWCLGELLLVIVLVKPRSAP